MSANTFGDTLRALRNTTQLSQSKLADACEYDHSFVSRLESGERMPTRNAVTRLAAALKLSPQGYSRLLVAAGFLPSDVSVLYHTPELAQLDRALEACPDQQAKADALASVRMLLRALPYGVGGI